MTIDIRGVMARLPDVPVFAGEDDSLAILLGTTWSPAAADLSDLDQLVDIVEAPGWAISQALAAGRRRLLLHNMDIDVSLADSDYINEEWGVRVREAARLTGTLWFSLHLGFASERVRFLEHMLPESEPLARDELFPRIVDSVNRAKSMLDLPLLLENLDYCPEGAYEHICDPEFISAALEATDTGLLLDLAHLQVSASWFEMSPQAMLARLPLNRVVEVHLSGPRSLVDAGDGNSGRLDDVHEIITDREVQLLRDVLSESNPRAVVLEYRRDAVALREQLAILGGVLGRRWRGRPC